MALFNIAVGLTLDEDHEGGYQCDPKDRGNWTGGKIGGGELKGTNGGISAHEFPSLDIKNLTIEQIKEIYLAKYWDPHYDSIIDQLIANKLFDMGVLFGVKEAVLKFQEILRTDLFVISEDGLFGEMSLLATNKCEPVSLLVAYKTTFVNHVLEIGTKNPAEQPNVSSWIRRINGD